MPRSVARSTARLEGAPTATSIGQPATAAFWTSSKDKRPLTQSTWSASGRSCSRNAQPTTLSSALCRPTSSRTHNGSPTAEKSPVACRPPVTANAACASRSRSGSDPTSDIGSRSCDSTRGASTSTASSAPLPQTPHDDEVKKLRCSSSGSNPGASTSTVFAARSSGSRASRGCSPSERQKPSASSSSCPGVRIVTATGRPAIRISSGSSTATRSGSVVPAGSRRTSTAAAE